MKSEKKYWLDGPRNVRKIVYALCLLCAVLLVTDLLYHKHPHFEFEKRFGFFCWFSFIAGVCLVLGSRVMRKLLQREEDYYDR